VEPFARTIDEVGQRRQETGERLARLRASSSA
jgi:hypothetical protein